jgi:hypothetical protein
MDELQKPSNYECYAPSSEPFRISSIFRHPCFPHCTVYSDYIPSTAMKIKTCKEHIIWEYSALVWKRKDQSGEEYFLGWKLEVDLELAPKGPYRGNYTQGINKANPQYSISFWILRTTVYFKEKTKVLIYRSLRKWSVCMFSRICVVLKLPVLYLILMKNTKNSISYSVLCEHSSNTTFNKCISW